MIRRGIKASNSSDWNLKKRQVCRQGEVNAGKSGSTSAEGQRPTNESSAEHQKSSLRGCSDLSGKMCQKG